MLHFSSASLWPEVEQVCKKAARRQAAFAYTTSDLIGLKKGDVLIVNASDGAIHTGASSASLLIRLMRKGVSLYNHPTLHAKVVVAGDVVVVGSGNMSNSSANILVEAAIVTNAPTVVGQAESFIEQLKAQATPLSADELKRLARLKVRRPMLPFGRPKHKRRIPIGHGRWLVGLHELDHLRPGEEALAAKAIRETEKMHHLSASEISWIRWAGRSGFPANAQPGDHVIQIWRPTRKSKRPSVVFRPVPILLRKRRKNVTFFFTGEPKGRRAEVSWKNFRAIASEFGITRIGMNSCRLLPPRTAEQLAARIGWR